MESHLVPAEGFSLELIEIGGLKRVGVRQVLTTLWQLPFGILQIAAKLRSRRVRGGIQHGWLRGRPAGVGGAPAQGSLSGDGAQCHTRALPTGASLASLRAR